MKNKVKKKGKVPIIPFFASFLIVASLRLPFHIHHSPDAVGLVLAWNP